MVIRELTQRSSPVDVESDVLGGVSGSSEGGAVAAFMSNSAQTVQRAHRILLSSKVSPADVVLPLAASKHLEVFSVEVGTLLDVTPKSGLLGLVIQADKRQYHLSAKWALNQATGRKDLSAEGFELCDRNRFPTVVLAQRLVDLGQVAGLIAAHEAGLSSPSGEAEAPC